VAELLRMEVPPLTHPLGGATLIVSCSTDCFLVCWGSKELSHCIILKTSCKIWEHH